MLVQISDTHGMKKSRMGEWGEGGERVGETYTFFDQRTLCLF